VQRRISDGVRNKKPRGKFVAFLNRQALAVFSLGLSMLAGVLSPAAHAERGGEPIDKYRCDSGYKLKRDEKNSQFNS
jgi:hypothetical protein